MGIFDSFYKSKKAKEYYRKAKLFEEKDFETVTERTNRWYMKGYGAGIEERTKLEDKIKQFKTWVKDHHKKYCKKGEPYRVDGMKTSMKEDCSCGLDDFLEKD